VRPRLAGRFEPTPDAFAPEAPARASAWGESDSEALGLSLEVETRPAPTRDVEHPRDSPEATRTHAPRPEASDAHERIVFVRETHEERPVLRPERNSSQTSEHTHDAPTPGRESTMHDAQDAPSPTLRPESGTQTRADEEGDASVRLRCIVPASVEEARPVKPFTQMHRPAPFNARARGDRRTPSTLEPREPSRHELDDTQRPSADVRPAPASPPARREADGEQRASEEKSSLTRVEPARAEARAKESEGEAESYATLHVRRARQEATSTEQQPARRGARSAATRDTARASAEPAPTINVTIGRVEVRATQGQPAAKRRADGAAPRMNLDDYLRRRNGEVRE
jgi:hypothetical protein